MKTLRRIKICMVAFIALFMSVLFCNEASAQQIDVSKENGILSMETEVENSVMTIKIVVDENIVNLDLLGTLIDNAIKSASYQALSAEDKELYEEFQAIVDSYVYIVKGNNSGRGITKKMSPLEFFFVERIFDVEDDYDISDEFMADMSIEEIVSGMNVGLGGEGEVVIKGKKLFFNIEVPATEFAEINALYQSEPELIELMLQEALLESLDESSKFVFDIIKKRGYAIVFSYNCGNNAPIVININY